MIKELFGWLIAVCRRWALGSNYNNKTSRARYGLSLICSFYLLGLLLNLVFIFEPNVPEWIPREAFSLLLILIIIMPLILLRVTYPNNIAELYIQKYQPKDSSHNLKQNLLAFAFCFGGWFVLAGPFLIHKFMFID